MSMTASEMGRRGAAVRWNKTSEADRHAVGVTLAQASIVATEQRRAEVLARELIAWKDCKPVVGDVKAYLGEEWARKIPHMYEALFDASLRGYVSPLTIDLLKTMTAMTPLAPTKLRVADLEDASLPDAAVDVSNLDAETLAKLAGVENFKPMGGFAPERRNEPKSRRSTSTRPARHPE